VSRPAAAQTDDWRAAGLRRVACGIIRPALWTSPAAPWKSCGEIAEKCEVELLQTRIVVRRFTLRAAPAPGFCGSFSQSA
jgi:hypothetical protein